MMHNQLQSKTKRIACTWGMIFMLISPLFFLGCGESNQASIGALLPHEEENTQVIWAHVAEQLKTSASGKAAVNIKAAGQNPEVQYRQFQELVDAGIDVLILVAVNVNSAAAIVREAHEEDIQVIAFDRMISNARPDFYVSFEYEKTGEMMANYALEHKPRGNYVLLWGDRADNNAMLLRQGQLNVLKPLVNMGRIDLMHRSHVNSWSFDNSLHAMQKVLAHTTDTIHAVLASNDRIAGGAYKALEQFDLASDVLITGMDADLSACRRIVKGQQTCTVYKSFIKQTDVAYEAALKMARTGKAPESDVTVNNDVGEIPARLLTPVIVDQSNLEETVIQDGLFSKAQIYE